MHDKTHITASGSAYCDACGQLIRPAPSYGERGSSNRIGIALSILLHVLMVGYYLMRPAPVRPVLPPTRESAMVYVAPLADKPQPSAPAKKVEPSKVKPPPPPRQPRVAAITPPKPPRQPKLETVVPPVVAPVPTPVQEVDMAAYIASRQKQRGAQAAPEAQESESERANRVARANIAGAQGQDADSDKGGGIVSVVGLTSYSATIKFRGFNANFKRRWLSQTQVELGTEQDIETAVIKKMIELIRKEKPGDFLWDSHRLGRVVPMSGRPEDAAELQAFLMKEVFPEYRARR